MSIYRHISVANNRIILGDILGKRVYISISSYKKPGNAINIVGQKGKIRTILQVVEVTERQHRSTFDRFQSSQFST